MQTDHYGDTCNIKVKGKGNSASFYKVVHIYNRLPLTSPSMRLTGMQPAAICSTFVSVH